MNQIDFGQTYKALLNSPDECGDVGLIEFYDNFCLAALIDGLGHGKSARSAALLASDYISKNLNTPPNILLSRTHEHIKGTRGAVAAICKIDLKSAVMTFSGIGNITVKLLNSNIQLISKEGVIGYIMSTPAQKEIMIENGEIIVLYSDGIKAHFDNSNKQRWHRLSAQQIAEEIMKDYCVDNDDASCIVLKYS